MAKKFGNSSIDRKRKSRESKKVYLLICEGENTEPDYFNFLKKKIQKRESTFNIVVKGNQGQHKKLVDNAISISKKENIKSNDEVWCIFDRERETTKDGNPELPLKNILGAIELAKKKKFFIGLSNQTFEYWILFHLENLNGDYLDKDEYINKINSIINKNGFKFDEKTKNIKEELFNEILYPNLQHAIKRANSIQKKCPGKDNCFQKRNCSTINHLVVRLLKDAKEFVEFITSMEINDCNS